MFFTLIIIFICFIFSFSSLKQYRYPCFIILGIILAVHSGLRSTDVDYSEYVYAYYNIHNVETEPTFKIIVCISKFIYENEPIIMFIIYAFLGVFLKLKAISILSKFIFLSLAIYVADYYILHEMTQIRAGIAGGFFLLSIKPLYNKNWKKFFLYSIISILFHYSAIVILGLFLLRSKSINKLFWGCIIPISYISLPIIRYGLSFLMAFSIGSDKIDAYIYALSNLTETTINIFSIIQLLRIVIAYILLFNCNKCYKNNPYSYILLKCYILGIVCLVLFSSVDVIAFRISEIFLLSEIILIPLISYIIKPLKVGKLISVGYSLILLLIMISQKII